MQGSNIAARLPNLVLLVLTGCAAVYFAARAAGAAGGLLATVAVCCAGALVVRLEPQSADSEAAGRIFDGTLLALPGALTVYLAFDSGGYFPDGPAFAAMVLALMLIVRLVLVDRPFRGFDRPVAIGAGALGLLALWALLSATWSNAFGRSLLEFDRVLAYFLVLLLFGSIPRSFYRLRWMVRILAIGIVFVAAAALATRLLPHTFPVDRTLDDQSLSYPLTYSNALGILCVIGGVFCLHLTSSLRERRFVRALAAAAMPLLAVAVYLTLSRGPVVAAVVALAAYAVLGRPRGLVTGLLAVVPASIVAVVTAYENELLTSKDRTGAAAVTQGKQVLVGLALCALGAAVARFFVAPLDTRVRSFSLPTRLRNPITALAWVTGVAVVLTIALVAGVPGWVSERSERFVHEEQGTPGADIRRDVTDVSNHGLVDNWSVALHAFGEHPLRGEGAGTYELTWRQERPASQVTYDVKDAHSLYAEVAGELGIVGLVLLAVALVAVLAALAPARRGGDRSLYAAVFAAALAWAAHAAVEWDWEMPAVSLWLFALGGVGLARHRNDRAEGRISQGARVALGLLLLGLAVVPGLVFVSERQLDESARAFERDDCPKAIERADASISTLGARPEPYEVLALCQVRLGHSRPGVPEIQKAVDRDPANWKFRYSQALVLGTAGRDPRPAAHEARRLNPHFRLTEELVRALDGAGRRDRRRISANLARTEGLYVVR